MIKFLHCQEAQPIADLINLKATNIFPFPIFFI